MQAGAYPIPGARVPVAGAYIRLGRERGAETPMGLFRDLGRRAERLKQQVQSAADATHECADCGAMLEADPERCPECGSDDLVALD